MATEEALLDSRRAPESMAACREPRRSISAFALSLPSGRGEGKTVADGLLGVILGAIFGGRRD